MNNNFDKEHFANVHSFESFGTVDGPGIRFVIFLQGCCLQCKYCHNRDTWSTSNNKIIGINEIIEKTLTYKTYIKPSGGVTVSGGEPLLQAKFLVNLFKELKKYDLHLAIDTSGMVDLSYDIKEVLNLTDLVILDIKHIDDEKCKNLVGFSNKKELEFAKYLSDNSIPMWIRQVIIPSITDDEQDLLRLRDFISSLNSVEKVEFLPYHDIGKYKWDNLNIKYELDGIRSATQNDIDRAKKITRVLTTSYFKLILLKYKSSGLMSSPVSHSIVSPLILTLLNNFISFNFSKTGYLKFFFISYTFFSPFSKNNKIS